MIAIAAGWIALRAARQASERSVTQLVGPTMGGSWSVRLARPLDARAAGALQIALQQTLDRLDGQMSTWKPDSDLSRFNASRGTSWHPVPADVAAVVAEAQRVSDATGGAFDVTVGPLVNLWGFGPSTAPADPAARIPPDDAIAAARARVGYRRLQVRTTPPALRKADADIYLDLSGIAQGYAADVVAARLDAAGVADYLVDICGEVRAGGSAAHGRPWRVAVQAPVPDTRRPLRGVQLINNLALATSGDYQNFFTDAVGHRYSHEIDPRTGRPVAHRLASVSVAHASAATADAMATALLVLGPDEGFAHAEQHGLAVLFVVRNEAGNEFETRATPAFESMATRDAPASAPETTVDSGAPSGARHPQPRSGDRK
jgi:thiamine biosynthesis lipoprotein